MKAFILVSSLKKKTELKLTLNITIRREKSENFFCKLRNKQQSEEVKPNKQKKNL